MAILSRRRIRGKIVIPFSLVATAFAVGTPTTIFYLSNDSEQIIEEENFEFDINPNISKPDPTDPTIPNPQKQEYLIRFYDSLTDGPAGGLSERYIAPNTLLTTFIPLKQPLYTAFVFKGGYDAPIDGNVVLTMPTRNMSVYAQGGISSSLLRDVDQTKPGAKSYSANEFIFSFAKPQHGDMGIFHYVSENNVGYIKHLSSTLSGLPTSYDDELLFRAYYREFIRNLPFNKAHALDPNHSFYSNYYRHEANSSAGAPPVLVANEKELANIHIGLSNGGYDSLSSTQHVDKSETNEALTVSHPPGNDQLRVETVGGKRGRDEVAKESAGDLPIGAVSIYGNTYMSIDEDYSLSFNSQKIIGEIREYSYAKIVITRPYVDSHFSEYRYHIVSNMESGRVFLPYNAFSSFTPIKTNATFSSIVTNPLLFTQY